MKYDFTSIMDRKGKDAVAIDAVGFNPNFIPKPREGFDPIPMWTADMNFPVCPTIPEALIARAKEPHYGYFVPLGRPEYYAEIIKWQQTRHGFTNLTSECIGYQNGVLGGVISALNVLCSRGDNVLIHSPTYVGFTKSLTNNGYKMVLSDLVQDENGIYRMDFSDMEKKIQKNNIHAMIFCSPHNPCGRVWEQWELEKMVQLCEKYDVKIVADEIWADIVRPGVKHTPTQLVNEWARQNTVALYAPSKTFNLAGLVGSYHIIFNKTLRDRVNKESSLSHYNSMNVLSMHALVGAYKPEGYEWCDELCQVIAGNVDYACDYIEKHFDGVKVTKPEGTYMIFLDCTEWCEKHGKTIEDVYRAGQDVGVVWQDGRQFHGLCHVRMNLASPLSRVQEAFDRLDKYVFNA